MNLQNFKEKLSKLFSNLNSKLRNTMINNLENLVPESKREETLEIIKACNLLESNDLVSSEDLKKVKEFLINLVSGEYYLVKSYNPTYVDKPYLSDKEQEYRKKAKEEPYKDPKHLVPDLEILFSLINKLYENKEYDLVSALGYPALTSTITLIPEILNYSDLDQFGLPHKISVENVVSYLKLPLDFKKFADEILKSYFLIHKDEDNSKAIKEILINNDITYRKFEDLIPYFTEFSINLNTVIESWIDYILENSEDFRKSSQNEWSRYHDLNYDEDLLIESLKLLGDETRYEEFILEHMEDLPDLYANHLIKEVEDKDKQVELAFKAFEKLEDSPKIRKRILDEIKDYVIDNPNYKEEDRLLTLENFYVRPSLTNYLELVANDLDDEAARERIARLFMMHPKNFYWNEKEYQLKLLHVLNRQFDDALAIIMAAPDFFGDHTENVTTMVTLLLYLLYKGEELPEALNKRIEYLDRFHFKDDVFIPLREETDYDFKTLLKKWKSEIPEEEIDEAWIESLEKFLDKHIERILPALWADVELEACAEFIATIGEILDSRGLDTKENYMQKFHEKYSNKLFAKYLSENGLSV